LRFPVFVDGENYSGTPSILSTPLLREQLMTGLAIDAATLHRAIFVPLGSTVGVVGLAGLEPATNGLAILRS
jgi:hypothetical protein